MTKYLKLSAFLWIAACAPPVSTPIVPASVSSRSGSANQRIATYCLANQGRKIGNGECWTLADEAFRASGTRRPGSDLRVWGRQVNISKEDLKAGDVIEFESAWFSDGIVTGRFHTAVVVTGGHPSQVEIAEQNWGKKTVRIRTTDLTKLTRGKVTVYRP